MTKEPRKVRVLVLNPDGHVKDVEVPDVLEAYQELVGGHLEAFGRTIDGLARFCNEDGRELGLKHSLWSGVLGCDVVGPVFLARTQGPEMASVNGEDLLRWQAWSRGEPVRMADIKAAKWGV